MPNGRRSRPGFSSGSSAATICRFRSSIPRPAVAAMGCIPTGPMKIAVASRSCPICWRWPRCGNWRVPISIRRTPWRFAPSVLEFSVHSRKTRNEGTMLQTAFINRRALYLRPDPARVIVRPFKPTTEPRDLNPTDKTRANHIVERVLNLDPEAAAGQLADVLENFQGRHRNLLKTFERRADEMEEALLAHCTFSEVQRQLLGAYFLHEYSFEASALFNPSIVPHPDQSGIPNGSLRFILSLRAVGEGHVSSLTFRAGVIAADGSIRVDPTARLATSPRIAHRTAGPIGDEVEIVFEPAPDISERVIFPV